MHLPSVCVHVWSTHHTPHGSSSMCTHMSIRRARADSREKCDGQRYMVYVVCCVHTICVKKQQFACRDRAVRARVPRERRESSSSTAVVAHTYTTYMCVSIVLQVVVESRYPPRARWKNPVNYVFGYECTISPLMMGWISVWMVVLEYTRIVILCGVLSHTGRQVEPGARINNSFMYRLFYP